MTKRALFLMAIIIIGCNRPGPPPDQEPPPQQPPPGPTYTLTAIKRSAGELTLKPQGIQVDNKGDVFRYKAGTAVTIGAMAAQGYHIVKVIKDGETERLEPQAVYYQTGLVLDQDRNIFIEFRADK